MTGGAGATAVQDLEHGDLVIVATVRDPIWIDQRFADLGALELRHHTAPIGELGERSRLQHDEDALARNSVTGQTSVEGRSGGVVNLRSQIRCHVQYTVQAGTIEPPGLAFGL
jgi:hypothetical protein